MSPRRDHEVALGTINRGGPANTFGSILEDHKQVSSAIQVRSRSRLQAIAAITRVDCHVPRDFLEVSDAPMDQHTGKGVLRTGHSGYRGWKWYWSWVQN